MAGASGRYKDVARAPMPGDLPAESRVGGPDRPHPVRIAIDSDPADRRRKQRAIRCADSIELATSRAGARAAQIQHGVVSDPNPSLRGRRQKAAINIKTDALEYEYARGRITDAAYWAARTYQAVLEKSRTPLSGGGAWNPGNRVDQVISHEIAILSRIVRAEEAVTMIRDTAPVLGQLGQRVLELVLVEGLTIAAAATRLRGSADRQTVIFFAGTFRESCELLVDHWCGPRQRAPRT